MSADFVCSECGAELTVDGVCPECDEPSFVITLPYGYKVDCIRSDVYENVRTEAGTFSAAGNSFQPEDWATIREVLQLSVSIYLEDDGRQRERLLQTKLRLLNSLGVTRQQRIAVSGSALSPLDLLADEAKKAEEYCNKHAGEFTWRSRCPKCSAEVISQMEAPHAMFSVGDDDRSTVWNESLLPFIRRYYLLGTPKGRKALKGADYARRDWMDKNRVDGGLSIADAARIMNLSPVGVLYTLWAHSSDSGDENLPSLKDMVGFEFDMNRPETMRPYLPEGYFDSSEFARELVRYQEAKKKLKALRKWRAQHRYLILWWIIKNRLLFFDFYGPRLSREHRWKTWLPQIPSTLSDVSLERDGRGTGKSERVKMSAAQAALVLSVEREGDCVLVAAPDEQHVRSIYDSLATAFEGDEFFRACLVPGRARKIARHGGALRLSGDRCIIYFRFPGIATKDAFSLQQYHASALIVDEVGLWSAAAERAVLSSVRSQSCICLKYFGVVILESPDMPIYYYTVWPDRFTKFRGRVFNLSSMINIYDYNLSKHSELLQTLGGQITSNDFAKQVMGEVGKPTQTEFTPSEIEEVCTIPYDPPDGKPLYYLVRISAREGEKKSIASIIGAMPRGKNLPGMDVAKKDSRNCIFSFDYGSSDPSQLWVLTRHPNDSTIWRLSYRVEMQGIGDDDQIEVIDELVRLYSPQFIAMDMTGTHNRVAAILTSSHTEGQWSKDYRDLIWPVNFQTSIVTKYHDIKPLNPNVRVVRMNREGRVYWIEREHTRAWAMSRAHLWFQRRKIQLPQADGRLKTEFMRLQVEERTNSFFGKKWHGVDHNISAFLCFIVCHWQNYELREPQRREEYNYDQTFAPVAIGAGEIFY